jgi:hypothetical protein
LVLHSLALGRAITHISKVNFLVPAPGPAKHSHACSDRLAPSEASCSPSGGFRRAFDRRLLPRVLILTPGVLLPHPEKYDNPLVGGAITVRWVLLSSPGVALPSGGHYFHTGGAARGCLRLRYRPWFSTSCPRCTTQTAMRRSAVWTRGSAMAIAKRAAL